MVNGGIVRMGVLTVRGILVWLSAKANRIIVQTPPHIKHSIHLTDDFNEIDLSSIFTNGCFN